MGFEIGEHFQLAVLASVIYAFEMILVGFFIPGRVRGQVFTEDFMVENFGAEHQNATGVSVKPTQGYPDMGHGRFSDKLPYKDWLRFAKAQRTHYNFLEQQAPLSLFIIVGGLGYPIFSAIVGFVAIVARLLYSIGYMNAAGNTNAARMMGALLGDIALMITFVLSVISCIEAY